jgi:hypothetical protein
MKKRNLFCCLLDAIHVHTEVGICLYQLLTVVLFFWLGIHQI